MPDALKKKWSNVNVYDRAADYPAVPEGASACLICALRSEYDELPPNAVDDNCARCGVAILHNVIFPVGAVPVCNKCAFKHIAPEDEVSIHMTKAHEEAIRRR